MQNGLYRVQKEGPRQHAVSHGLHPSTPFYSCRRIFSSTRFKRGAQKVIIRFCPFKTAHLGLKSNIHPSLSREEFSFKMGRFIQDGTQKPFRRAANGRNFRHTSARRRTPTAAQQPCQLLPVCGGPILIL
ncbi:hypothetical protein [Ligaoa zhengdingensis]|uniref:hypothetical protein n=1 Tax=Ligaoa zhengdingensis TaxID=2763658 RepID=UPI0031B9CF78